MHLPVRRYAVPDNVIGCSIRTSVVNFCPPSPGSTRQWAPGREVPSGWMKCALSASEMQPVQV
jgi:hypothetical protein